MQNQLTHIQEVTIDNFWDKHQIHWKLHRDVNILAGGNGSGKSTLLDLLYSLLFEGNIVKERRGLLDSMQIIFNNEQTVTYNHIKINDTIKNIEKKAESEVIFRNLIEDLKAKHGEKYENLKAIQGAVHLTSFEDTQQLSLQELHQKVLVGAISTFDSQVISSNDIKKISNDEVHTQLDLLIYLLQKKYLDYQLTISKRKDVIMEQLNQLENPQAESDKLRFPQKRFLTILDELFMATNKKVNRDKNEISFLLDDNKEIKPYQLSSGEKQLLIILLTVLVQDQRPTILFMDEPEISLHIDWQRKLIGFILELNPHIQLIIATHSPAIIMEGWLDKVFEINDLFKKN